MLTNLIKNKGRLLNRILSHYSEIYDATEGQIWHDNSIYSPFSKTHVYFDFTEVANLDCVWNKKKEKWFIDGKIPKIRELIDYLKEKSRKNNNPSLYLFAAKIAREKANVGFISPHCPDVTQTLTREDSAPKEIAELLNNLAIDLCLDEGSSAGVMNAVRYVGDIRYGTEDEDAVKEAYSLYNHIFEMRGRELPENLRRRLLPFEYFVFDNTDTEQLRRKYRIREEIKSIRGPRIKEFSGPIPTKYLLERLDFGSWMDS